jgi:predicted TIM-barrel fold metal-dependent hydrolase
VPFAAVARADRKRLRPARHDDDDDDDEGSTLWQWMVRNYDHLHDMTKGGKVLTQIVNAALLFMKTEKDQHDVQAFFREERPDVATKLKARLEEATTRLARRARERDDLQALAKASEAATVAFWDPHFHIWDVTRTEDPNDQLHDPDILFAPEGEPDYTVLRYESEFTVGGFAPAFKHTGGAFVEAISACFPAESGEALNAKCAREAEWASLRLLCESTAARGKTYVVVGSCCLEAKNAKETLQRLIDTKGVVGIRQILNKDPSWPRNKDRPNLLEDDAWRSGFAALASTGRLRFDCQCNPSQFAAAAALFAQYPDTTIVLNHLGCFTAENLAAGEGDDGSESYWGGLACLARLPQVHVKLSMLCYAHKNWDVDEGRAKVFAAVRRVCEMFGEDRVFFASNYPVDLNDGWGAERLFPMFLEMAQELGLDLGKVFSGNARAVYGAD